MGCNCGGNHKKKSPEKVEELLLAKLPGSYIKLSHDKNGAIKVDKATLVKLNKN